MALLHRWKGYDLTADWTTGYFDLGLNNLKFMVELGSFTDWHADFLGPDGVGNKQWGGAGGPPSSKLSTGHF